jgi:drug/metabolite transporter (DMT)-like permease
LIARVGELAALATALCWTATAICFTSASKKVGSLPVNIIRLLIAFVLFSITGLIARGRALPLDADAAAWFWLSLSGLVGFTLGDLFLFRAFVLIGARLSILTMSLWPLVVTALSIFVLDERPNALDLLGMACTLTAVAWVVTEKKGDEPHGATRQRAIGVGLAILGAIGQGAGLVLSKLGMRTFPDAFAATHIRVITGSIGFIVIIALMGSTRRVWLALQDGRAMGYTALGAFFGPFLGVGLSLLAVQHTQAGVAATIMTLTPVLIVPAVAIVYRESISPRAVLGALLAFGGVALLFL